MTTITEPCLLPDVPDDVYHAGGIATPGPQLSQSLLKLLIPPSTPAHFQWRLLNPEPPRRVFDVGRAAHTLALGRGEEPVPCPAEHLSVDGKMTTKAAKEWAAGQRSAGLVPLTPGDYDLVRGMADALVHHEQVAEILTDPSNAAEVSAFAPHPELRDVWFRGRFDLLGGLLWDYKTTACAAPSVFAKSAWAYGYHVQDVLYRTLHEVVTGTAPDPMRFIVQEKTPPYLCSVITLDADFDRAARQQISAALDLHAELTDIHGDPTDPATRWPGYPETAIVSPPPWAKTTTKELDPDLEAEFAALLAEGLQ